MELDDRLSDEVKKQIKTTMRVLGDAIGDASSASDSASDAAANAAAINESMNLLAEQLAASNLPQTDLAQIVVQTLDPLIQTIKGMLGPIQESIGTIHNAVSSYSTPWNTIFGLEIVGSPFKAVMSSLTDIDNLIAWLMKVVQNILHAIFELMRALWEAISKKLDAAQKQFNNLKEQISKLWNQLTETYKDTKKTTAFGKANLLAVQRALEEQAEKVEADGGSKGSPSIAAGVTESNIVASNPIDEDYEIRRRD